MFFKRLFAQCNSADLLEHRQALVEPVDHSLQCFRVRDDLRVGIDLGAYNTAVLTHQRSLNSVNAIELFLKLLGRDVFAVWQDYEILRLPVKNT